VAILRDETRGLEKPGIDKKGTGGERQEERGREVRGRKRNALRGHHMRTQHANVKRKRCSMAKERTQRKRTFWPQAGVEPVTLLDM